MDGRPYLRRLPGAYTYAGLTTMNYAVVCGLGQYCPPRWTPVTSDVCWVLYVYVGLEVLDSTETFKTKLTPDFLPIEMESMSDIL